MRRALGAVGLVARLMPRRVTFGIYSRPFLARIMRGLLNAVVPAGLQEVEVVGGALAGTKLLLDLKNEKYLWLGTYEPWVQDEILSRLRSGMHAWDVGAFIGYHTLLMRRMVGPSRVVALEPDPVNRGRLQRHLALNAAQDVTVISAAAGAVSGRARLQRVTDHPPETQVLFEGRGECEVVRLDDLLERFPAPSLVKMDVEGAEAEILAGAPRLVEEVRPVWVMEVHGPPGQHAVEILRRAGYQVTRIGKGFGAPEDLPVGGPAHVVALP